MWIRKLLTELGFAIGDNVNLRKKSDIDEQIDPTSVDDFDRHDDLSAHSPQATRSLAPTPVAVDNKSVESSVNNPETSQRTRHLDMRYFKVRDYIRAQEIRVRHIGTKSNPADFFTKALPRSEFARYRGYFGMEQCDDTS